MVLSRRQSIKPIYIGKACCLHSFKGWREIPNGTDKEIEAFVCDELLGPRESNRRLAKRPFDRRLPRKSARLVPTGTGDEQLG